LTKAIYVRLVNVADILQKTLAGIYQSRLRYIDRHALRWDFVGALTPVRSDASLGFSTNTYLPPDAVGYRASMQTHTKAEEKSPVAMRLKLWLLVALSCLIALIGAAPAHAQGFPSRPLRIVVPFPAGGSTDTLTRLVSQHLSQRWGQPVLVDNKPGGGTVIGGAIVAKAPADGYTLLVVANSLVINAKLRDNLPYPGIKAFEPVAMLTNSPQVLAVSSASPYNTLGEFLDAARAQPGVLSYSTVGPTTTQHIAGEMLKRAAGVQLTYAPFPGGGPAANAVLGGHVSAVLTNLSEVAGMIEAGKLRPLAVTTLERLSALKQVPTVAESGYPDYEAVAWFGVAAPAGTPRDIVDKLAEGFAAALNDTDIRQRLIGAGLYPAYLGPAAFAAHIAQQYTHYARVIDEAKIRPE
jgi:tripartite-type tricarboxylate transporter receptor subunit TctC